VKTKKSILTIKKEVKVKCIQHGKIETKSLKNWKISEKNKNKIK
jgi:hypothetical protein